MVSFLMLLASVSAQETECTERVSPQVITQGVENVRQGILNGEEDVGTQLNELFHAMTLCVDGPVERRDVGELLLARGAFGVLSKKVSPEAAQQQMTWAYAIAGRDVFDDAYGMEVQEAFDIATEGVLPRATIDLSFDRDPRVVVIDGEVIYDRGQRTVSATFHLIQWLDKQGWHSEVLVLEPGDEVLVGSEVSSQQRRQAADRRRQEEAEEASSTSSRSQIRERRGRNARKPRPPREKLKGPRLHLELEGSYGLMMARFVHEEGASIGGVALPSGGASIEWDLIKGIGFYLNGHMDPGSIQPEFPSLQTRASSGIRFGKRGRATGFSAAVGAAWRLSSESTSGGPEANSPFEQSSLWGGQASLRFVMPALTSMLQTEIFPEEYTARAQVVYHLPTIEVIQFQPRVGLIVDWVLSDTGAKISNQAYGAQAQLQLARSF